MKFADSLIIDGSTGEVTIDGESLGLYLADEAIQITSLGDALGSIVRLPILVTHIEVRGR